MRRFVRTALLASFVFSSAAVFGANLEDGLSAYAQGDYDTAWTICQPLADEGNVEAMFCVGQMHANGFGVAMDDEQAMKWFGMAAGEGHPEALYRLAVMHANGWGVPMNDVRTGQLFVVGHAGVRVFPPDRGNHRHRARDGHLGARSHDLLRARGSADLRGRVVRRGHRRTWRRGRHARGSARALYT